MSMTKDDSPLISTNTSNPIGGAPATLKLRIKCSSSTTDLTVATYSSSTVLQLKEAVRSAIGPSARGRYLRLIASGRLLAPDSAELKGFRLSEGNVVHAVLAAPGVRGGQQEALSRGSTSSHRSINRFRGIGIGSNGLILQRNRSDDSAEDSGDDDDLEAGTQRMGFDRLRSTGLSRSEVAALRSYFSRQVDRYIQHRDRLRGSETSETRNINNRRSTENDALSSSSASSDEETDSSSPEYSDEAARLERLRREDEWMETQGPHSEFRLNLNANNPLLTSRMFFRNSGTTDDTMLMNMNARNQAGLLGTDRDFVTGFLLGCFIGGMMMFWVWMPNVTHKQKMGILTGICFQMVLNLLRNDAVISD